MGLLKGIKYNLRGLKLGLKTPKLLALGLLRFIAIILITVGLGSIILLYQQDIISIIWSRPESQWILWLWYLLSWIISTILILLSSVLSYLISQIIFAVVIMDKMSRITEVIETGTVLEHSSLSFFNQLFFLIKQEIPRSIIPVIVLILLSLAGWLTPLGPFITILSSLVAAIFLAWDNTDLVPARRFSKFKTRFGFLTKNLSFHLGFGLLFLIPVFNILSLSFAPIGATLFYLENSKQPYENLSHSQIKTHLY